MEYLDIYAYFKVLSFILTHKCCIFHLWNILVNIADKDLKWKQAENKVLESENMVQSYEWWFGVKNIRAGHNCAVSDIFFIVIQ